MFYVCLCLTQEKGIHGILKYGIHMFIIQDYPWTAIMITLFHIIIFGGSYLSTLSAVLFYNATNIPNIAWSQ